MKYFSAFKNKQFFFKNVVKQINLRDSGIFMLFYAKKLAHKEKLIVSEVNIFYFFKKI